MSSVFIINAHQAYPFSPGKLNSTLVDMAVDYLHSQGHSTQLTTMTDDWNVDEEIAKHQAADVVLQSPVNWMGVPWLMKKYRWTSCIPTAWMADFVMVMVAPVRHIQTIRRVAARSAVKNTCYH